MADQSPYLQSVPVKFDKKQFSLHQIQNDILEGISSFEDRFKIVYFYQNPSYDSVLPTALELLYQATDKLGEGKERDKVLIYGGKEHGNLTEAYEKTYFGSALFCNELFGYGKLNSKGQISGEKQTYQKGKRTKKSAEDHLIFSHTYKAFPSERIANQINSIIIKPPSNLKYWISEINKRAEEYGIPNLVVFDPYPSANKIKYYQGLGFQIYGWRHEELREGSEDKSSNLPLSDTRGMRLFSTERNYEDQEVREPELERLYKKLEDSLDEARRHSNTEIYGRSKLNTIRKLSRKLSSVSVPLTEYDKEYLRSPLSRDIDNFEKRIKEDIGEGATAEVFEAAHLLRDIKDNIQESNPKYDSLVTEVASSVSNDEESLILMPSKNEIRAFKRAVRNSKNPISLEESPVKFASFKAEIDFLINENFENVILSTYPFLKNNYLVSDYISPNTKVLMYPWEKKDYEHFQKLYSSIEQRFFSKEHREEVKDKLSKGESAEEPEIPKVRKEEFNPNETAEEQEDSRSLENLIKAERSMDVSRESFIGESESKPEQEEDGEVDEAIRMSLESGRELNVRPNKDLQVLKASDNVVNKPAVELDVGDTLVLVESSAAMNLNDLIRNKAENIPELRVYEEMASLWREELRRAVEKNDDSEEEVLERLKKEGSNISTSQTINNWLNDRVVGPQDPQDIVRIGEAYDIDDLKENGQQIQIAVSKVHRMRSMIIKKAMSALVTDDENMIEDLEEELNVDIDEFTRSLEFERVQDMENVKDVDKKLLNTAGEEFEVKVT